MAAVADWRERALERLERETFDLLVVGAGIVGAGIASEAARAGLRVALVDRGDFCGATSAASSKLIHGGLRYLRLGDVGLVRESHEERRLLLRLAPHLVRPLPFLFPLYRGGPYRPAALRAGLGAYAVLAGERPRRLVSAGDGRRLVPGLQLEGLRGLGAYADAWTHDGRLCLANVAAAERAGAVVLNHAEVVALRTVAGRVAGAELRDLLGGGSPAVAARAVVNATGPWVEHLRRLEQPDAPPCGRLSKGVHLLLEQDSPWSAALTIPHDGVRVSFAYPWEGMLLLGTTDTPYDGDPAAAGVGAADVRQVLAEAAAALDPALLGPERVRSSFAGLRVLPHGSGGGGGTAGARRETVFLRGRAGMLTVAGGKLTTYRRIALDALERLAPELGLRRLERRPAPLPGAADPSRVTAGLVRGAGLSPATAAHLAHLYGSEATAVVALGADAPELLEPLCPGAPEIGAQVVHAARHEWAATADDVLARRTTLAARGLASAELCARVEQLMARAWAF